MPSNRIALLLAVGAVFVASVAIAAKPVAPISPLVVVDSVGAPVGPLTQFSKFTSSKSVNGRIVTAAGAAYRTAEGVIPVTFATVGTNSEWKLFSWLNLYFVGADCSGEAYVLKYDYDAAYDQMAQFAGFLRNAFVFPPITTQVSATDARVFAFATSSAVLMSFYSRADWSGACEEFDPIGTFYSYRVTFSPFPFAGPFVVK